MIPVAGGVLSRVDVAGARKAFALIDKDVDRASMWTVRQAARKVGQYAKRAAPVYRGKPRARYYGGAVIDQMGKGDLKKSIHSSKRLKRVPGGFQVTIGPRGASNIYAAIQEARTPFMGPAVSRVSGEIESIAATAWTRASRNLH